MTHSRILSDGPKNIFTPGNLLINTANTIIVNVTEDSSLHHFSGQTLHSCTNLCKLGSLSDIWIKKNFKQFQGDLLIDSDVDYFDSTDTFSTGDIVIDVHNDVVVCVTSNKKFGAHFEGVVIKDSENLSTAKRGVHSKHFEFIRFNRYRSKSDNSDSFGNWGGGSSNDASTSGFSGGGATENW